MNAVDLGSTVSAVLTRLCDAVWRRSPLASVRGPRIHVAGRAVLTPTHSVHVVEIEGRRLVLGCHPNGFLVLSPEQDQGKTT